MSAYDIRTRDEWQEILDAVFRRLGMPAALLDENNVILQQSGTRNPLCRRIRGRKDSKSAICGQSQQYMAEMAWTTGGPVIEACEAGLAKFVLPLYHGGRRAGTLTACGSRMAGDEVEAFLIQKSAGLDEDAVLRLVTEVRSVDPEDLRTAAEDLFQRIQEG